MISAALEIPSIAAPAGASRLREASGILRQAQDTSGEALRTAQGEDWEACRAAWLDGLRAAETRRMYEIAVRDFLLSAGTHDLGRIRRGDVGRWAGAMRGRGLSESTIKVRLAALASLLRYAHDFHNLPDALGSLAGLSGSSTPYVKSRALTAEEVKRLLLKIPTQTIVGKRDFALISGFLILGRRNSEWREAQVCDFEMRGGQMVFRWSGKGHTDERVTIPQRLWEALSDYVAFSGGRGPADYIFLDRNGTHPISLKRSLMILKRYARLAGIQGNLRIHDLRHTAVRLRREAGADVEEIRRFLGHKSLATTQIYLHQMESAEAKRAEIVAEIVQITSVI